MSHKKLFGTDGIRGKANEYPMTPDVAVHVGKAVAEVFTQKNSNRNPLVIIGKDTRVSGYMIESALQAGLVSHGADVILVGPMPTPAIAHLVRSLNANAGIVISASHNPYEDNGIKLFGSDGYKLSDELESIIEKKIQAKEHKSKKLGKAYRLDEAQGRYIEFAKSTVKSQSLQGMKIVLDCANGAGYKVAPKIFAELGATVIIIADEPDGYNINKKCGALYPENIAKLVKKYNADLGICLDGDADRIIVCDENGTIVNGDQIIGMIASYLKEKGKLPKNKIAITVMSNIGLKKYLQNQKISFVETKVGDRYVIEEMKKQKLSLGGEQSGHIIIHDYVRTGDGIITGLQILSIMKEKGKISNLVKKISIFPQELINIKVSNKPDIKTLKVQELIESEEKKLATNGRILVRYSGTEKLCRVMVEAKTQKTAKTCADKLAKAIKKEIG